MEIVIDLTRFQEASNPLQLAWLLMTAGGWMILPILAVIGAWKVFVSTRQAKYARALTYVLLAIDIPRGNEQTPKAVESVFAHLHGIAKKGNRRERYLKGYAQHAISLEIISIEGHIQFLVRCTTDFRDLVESAFYAQYPDAAITEVEDYTLAVPRDPAAAGIDLWGAELAFYNKDVYPIKTYPFFEHSLSGEFLDPLASLLEIMGRLGPTEQVWLQIVITPAEADWRKRGKAEIGKLLGEKPKSGGGLLGLEKLPSAIGQNMYEALTASLIPPEPAGEVKKEKSERKKISELTPGEKSTIEAIEMKMAKLGFSSKVRMVYLAQKEYSNKGRGVTGVLGAIKQFNTQDLNGFKPHAKAKTATDYLFAKRRLKTKQRYMLYNYRIRKLMGGWKTYIMNTEELASMFHFPVISVKAPAVQKTEARRGEPPMRLPVEPVRLPGTEEEPAVDRIQPAPPPVPHAAAPTHRVQPASTEPEPQLKGTPPSNLPVG